MQSDNLITKRNDVAERLANELRSRCQCDFTRDRITEGGFQCFPDSPQFVTYRATLHGTLQASTSPLIRDIQDWLSSNTPLLVQAQLLNPDPTCAVAISSSSESECRPDETTTQGMETTPITENTTISTGIIAGVIIVVVIAMVIVLIIVIIVVRYKGSLKLDLLKQGTTTVM